MKTSYWLAPFAALIREHRRRKTIRDLQTLPSYLLEDIGIEREAIPTIVTGIMNPKASKPFKHPTSEKQPATATRDLLLSQT